MAVASALPMELDGMFRRGRFARARLNDTEYFKGVIRGTDVALFVSGVGGRAAYETAKSACRGLPLTAYICVGYSGALSPVLGPGEIVIGKSAESLVPGDGPVYNSEAGLVDLAQEAMKGCCNFLTGPLLAAPRVVVSAAEKAGLASTTGCLALDMESYGAARAAAEAGVPFLAVRAVSDSLDEDLPVDFNRFMKGGGMDWPRFIMHVAARPRLIAPLLRLGKNSRKASLNLAAAVECVLMSLPGETPAR